MNVERWWKHAVLYEVDAGGSGDRTTADDEALRSVTAHLEDIQALGVDAIVVQDPPLVQSAARTSAERTAEGPSRLEAFDDLVQQASRRRMRVLVELRPSTQADLTAEARFWLNRGIAGLYLSEAPRKPDGASSAALPGRREELLALREVLKGVAGERIVISEADPGIPSRAIEADEAFQTPVRGRRRGSSTRTGAGRPASTSAGDPEMLLVRLADPANSGGRAKADAVRTSLVRTIASVQRISVTSSTPLLALADEAGQNLPLTPSGDAAIGKVQATLLLGTGASAMIPGRGLMLPNSAVSTDSSIQSMAPGAQSPLNPYAVAARAAREAAARDAAAAVERHSLYEWYRRLNALAHGNATMRFGETIVLDHDADNALVWVRTPKAASPAVVLACNLSGRPVTFSLLDDVQRLHLRGTFLRTMLRSDDAMGPMSLRAVVLPPYAVYIGELRR